MYRKDIEQYLKKHNITQIDLVIDKDDKLAIYCKVKNGKLYDYTDHVVDRKRDIWGCLIWKNGKPIRIAFNRL